MWSAARLFGSMAVTFCLASLSLVGHAAGSEEPVNADATRARVTALFNAADWTALDSMGNAVVREYERNANAFAPYRTFFQVLPRHSAPEVLKAYEQWVERFPNSYSAAYARARYLGYMAMDSRGEDLSVNTPPTQMKRMSDLFDRGRADALRSIKLSSRPTLSYLQLIRAARYNGSHAEATKFYLESTVVDPDVLLVAEEHLIACRPRWGGNFKELDGLPQLARSKGLADAKAKALSQRAMLYASEDHDLQGNRKSADDSLSKLIASEPPDSIKAEAFLEAAYRAAKREDDAAVIDFGRRIAGLRGSGAQELYSIGKLLQKRKKPADAEAFFRLAVDRDPAHVYALSNLAGIARNAGRTQEALAYFDRALAIAPADKWVLAGRGWLKLNKLNDAEGAYHDSHAAARMGEPSAQNQLGYLYWSGRGTGKNHAEAVYWWYLSAEQKNPTAVENLAVAKRDLPADYDRLLEEAKQRARK